LLPNKRKKIEDGPNDLMLEHPEKQNKDETRMRRDIVLTIASMKYSVPFYCNHIFILLDGE